jgi:hypothetical protein
MRGTYGTGYGTGGGTYRTGLDPAAVREEHLVSGGGCHPKTQGEAVMKIAAIVERFPEQELAIRRLCNRDPGFLGSCEDYEVAATALSHWEGAGDAYTARADEYRQLLVEIEDEVLQGLAQHRIPVRGYE